MTTNNDGWVSFTHNEAYSYDNYCAYEDESEVPKHLKGHPLHDMCINSEGYNMDLKAAAIYAMAGLLNICFDLQKYKNIARDESQFENIALQKFMLDYSYENRQKVWQYDQLPSDLKIIDRWLTLYDQNPVVTIMRNLYNGDAQTSRKVAYDGKPCKILMAQKGVYTYLKYDDPDGLCGGTFYIKGANK
jgi:hypothetical protein